MHSRGPMCYCSKMRTRLPLCPESYIIYINHFYHILGPNDILQLTIQGCPEKPVYPVPGVLLQSPYESSQGTQLCIYVDQSE